MKPVRDLLEVMPPDLWLTLSCLYCAPVTSSLLAGSESDLAAELADVEIMTEQLRLQGMDRLIDFHKQKKLERLAARLGVIYTNE